MLANPPVQLQWVPYGEFLPPEGLGDTVGIRQLAQGRRKNGLEESLQRKYLPSAASAALLPPSQTLQYR